MPPWKNLEGVFFEIALSQEPFKNASGYGEHNCQNVQATFVDLSVIDQEQYRKELGTKDKRPKAISCIGFGLSYKAEKVSYTHTAKVPYCSLLLVEIKES